MKKNFWKKSSLAPGEKITASQRDSGSPVQSLLLGDLP